MKCRIRISHESFGDVLAQTRDLSDSGVYVKHPDLISLQPGTIVRGQVQDLPIPVESGAGRLVQLAQEHRHLFLGLLVTVGLCGNQTLFPSSACALQVTAALQGLAEQLPGSRVSGVQFDATPQVRSSFFGIAGVQIALAQAEAQHGVVHALRQHLFQRFKHR